METLRLSGETKGTEFFSQRTFFQLLTDKCLIFGKADGFSQRFRVKIPVKKCLVNTDRKKIEEDFFQFGRVDGSAIGRETDEKTGSDAFFRYFTGGTCKNLLTTVAY